MAKIRKDSKGRNLRPGEYQRGDGLYAYAYTLHGKRKWIYSSDLADLRKQAKQIEKDRDEGIRTQDASKITLNDMFETYMATKSKLKESTRNNYLYMWKKYIKDTDLACKPIGNIKKSDIQKFYKHLLDHGFATNSLDGINNLIHPTLEMAVDDDLLRKNPSKGVYRAMKDGDAKTRIALTIAEQQAFLNYIINSHTYNHWATVFVTLLGTGLRVGECVGLTKTDILLDQKAISVNHTLIYRQLDGKCQFRITTPKTQKGNRLVPMLPDVERYLRAHLEVMDDLYSKPCPTIQGYTDFIFHNRLGELMNPHCLNRAIERISRDYNAQETELAAKEDREPLLLPHFSVHNLRHTFCTRLFEVEPDCKFIQQVMGHADISTTMDIYTHITQEKMNSTVQSISKKLDLF